MLSNGWYWSGKGKEVIAYPPVDGWEVRCRWEGLPSGWWALTVTVREEDPAPWIPGPASDLREIRVRPVIEGCNSWPSPDPRVMEEVSRRIGARRIGQMIMCCLHTSSTQVSK